MPSNIYQASYSYLIMNIISLWKKNQLETNNPSLITPMNLTHEFVTASHLHLKIADLHICMHNLQFGTHYDYNSTKLTLNHINLYFRSLA